MFRPNTAIIRAALVFLCVAGLVVGSWAQFLPFDFYTRFPGFGRTWVSVDGPYNQHLIRDVGSLNLGMGCLAGMAWLRPRLVTPFAVGLATICYNLPHLAYHAVMLHHYPLIDQAGNMVTLGAALLASVILLATGYRTRSVRAEPDSAPVV